MARKRRANALRRAVPVVALAMLAATLMVHGIARGEPAEPVPSPQTCPDARAEPLSVAQNALDTAITERVEERLKKKEGDGFTEIEVSTVNGIVCLQGTVANMTIHDQAEKAARSIEGVQNVVNLLQIPIALLDKRFEPQPLIEIAATIPPARFDDLTPRRLART